MFVSVLPLSYQHLSLLVGRSPPTSDPGRPLRPLASRAVTGDGCHPVTTLATATSLGHTMARKHPDRILSPNFEHFHPVNPLAYK